MMTPKEVKLQKKRIKVLQKKWVRNLGLGWWRITHEYHEGEKEVDNTDYQPKVVNGRFVCAMDVTADYYYDTAIINYYLPIIATITSDGELEEYFVHELMHIFMSPMHSKAKAKEEELVATKLASALIWAREAGQKDGRNKD